MKYAYVIQPKVGRFVKSPGITATGVFLGNAEDSQDIKSFCEKIGAEWAIIGPNKYHAVAKDMEYHITKVEVLE